MQNYLVGDEEMIYDIRKLTISGIAGILVASLITASIVTAPWLRPATIPTFPSGLPLESPLTVNVIISNITEPVGVGSEAILTIILTSTCNASDVVVQFDLLQVVDDWPTGIRFIGENLTTWNGDLRANVSVIFTARIKAEEVGLARIKATATWYRYEYLRHEGKDSVWILVSENDIQVSQEPITPPGYYEATPGNGTLPMWPNGTLLEP